MTQASQPHTPRAAIEAPLRTACLELRRQGADPTDIAAALRYLSVEVQQEH